MQSSAPPDVLFFHCGQCATELSVPLAFQGIEGPCPCCGARIQAPAIDRAKDASPTLALPPLDRRHEPASVQTEAIPVSSWMDERGYGLPEGATSAVPVPVAAARLSRRLADSEAQGFQARMAIPPEGGPLDDSRRSNHEIAVRRRANIKKVDQAADHLLSSPAFRFARVALLVTTGGLCAGLGLYLQDRNWVLDLPWQPAPVEQMVDVPLGATPVDTKRTAEQENPFLAEDPSEMEVAPRALLAPPPEPVSVPVGATPMGSGTK